MNIASTGPLDLEAGRFVFRSVLFIFAWWAEGVDFQSAGRTFRMDHGIIGAASESGSVWRTRRYDDVASLLTDLSDDMKTAGDTRAPESVAKSYLAIPFLGPVHEGKQEPRGIVTILYADCGVFNFFADGDRVRHLVEMCEGFCRLFDSLQRCPFPNLRNFPLHKGIPVTGVRTVYPRIQECLETPSPPEFREVLSFNYEAAAA